MVDGTSGAAFLHFWSALLRGAPLAALPKPLLDRTVYDTACGVAGQVCAARQAAEAAALREGLQPGCCGASHAAPASLTEPPAETESPASPSPRDEAAAAEKTKAVAVAALPESSPLKGITVWPTVGGWARLLLRMATDSTLGMVRGRGTVIRMVLRFPAAELARLKAAAVAAGGSARLSTNDVLCAAIWRALAQSRRKRGPLDSAATGQATFCFVANTRALMLPAEQQLFVGNAVVIAQAELPASALRAGSLADAAAALRSAKARITPEAVRAEMAFVQAHADSRVTLGDAARNLRWNTLPYDGGCGMWDWTKVRLLRLGAALKCTDPPCFRSFLFMGWTLGAASPSGWSPGWARPCCCRTSWAPRPRPTATAWWSTPTRRETRRTRCSPRYARSSDTRGFLLFRSCTYANLAPRCAPFRRLGGRLCRRLVVIALLLSCPLRALPARLGGCSLGRAALEDVVALV